MNRFLRSSPLTDSSYSEKVWLGTSKEFFDGFEFDGYLLAGNEANRAKLLVSGDIGIGSYMNMWINYDRDDTFDSINELVLSDIYLAPSLPVLTNGSISDTLYADIALLSIPIEDSIRSGLYPMRIELNSMPNGEGEAIDYVQFEVPIVHESQVDAVTGTVDFSHVDEEAVDFPYWNHETHIHNWLINLWNSFLNIFSNDRSINLSSDDSSISKESESSSHEEQAFDVNGDGVVNNTDVSRSQFLR